MRDYILIYRPWGADAFYDNETNEDLKQVIRRLLSANEVLEHETAINRLRDEHTTSIFVKIASKIFEAVEIIHESITLDEILPSLSLVVTVVFILVGGYVMSYLVKMEEESVRKQLGAKGLKVDRKSGNAGSNVGASVGSIVRGYAGVDMELNAGFYVYCVGKCRKIRRRANAGKHAGSNA